LNDKRRESPVIPFPVQVPAPDLTPPAELSAGVPDAGLPPPAISGKVLVIGALAALAVLWFMHSRSKAGPDYWDGDGDGEEENDDA
jgi:hypothetical protein